MRVEEKRIFISDLPETATQIEIENAFKNYGNVTSVEIKERKELGPKNNSLFFAYINIEIDDRNLQQCFKDFSNERWLGQYVLLQVARESFLDRLKRERESAANTFNNVSSVENVSEVPQQVPRKSSSNGIRKEVKRKYKSSTESDSSDTDSSKNANKIEHIRPQNVAKKAKNSSVDKGAISIDTNETVNLVIKNNKGKVIDKNGLKIESVGNKPIIQIEKSKKVSLNSSEANLKRLQALNNMKKGYQSQKSLIQASLSKIDSYSNNKITFDESIADTSLKKGMKVGKPSRSINLFEDNPNEDEEFEVDFSFKEQFEGEEGQKLLELQSKYKNDKRFVLDQRFLDKNDVDTGKSRNDAENEISLEEEKRKEYEILEQVLGKKVNSKYLHQKESQSQMKSMLRFDPTHPEHSKFEVIKEQGQQKKRKKKDAEAEILNEKIPDEKEMPVVSKEIFYKVTDNLKENLHVEQGFSLLSMFGQKEGEEEEEEISDETPKPLGSHKSSILTGKNPFKYDSSDDEDETENIPKKDQLEVEKSAEPAHTNVNRSSFWSEPFFFNSDDYKFQDGFDFIEKMKSEDKNEFTKLRKDLKDIVKTKVRNNQRKHKPFKKKLGGNKRKKMIKIKKALKR